VAQPKPKTGPDSFEPGGLYDRIQASIEFIRSAGYGGTPGSALIFGSGLGAMAGGMQVEFELPYGEIPGFVDTTLEFHKGRLLFGKIADEPVVAMDGRFHRYEGYTLQQITFPVRVMRMLGAGTLLLSNLAGGLNPEFHAGDVVLIIDQINLMGDNPLIGANDDRLGPRFVDMSEPYSRRLIALAEKHAMQQGIRLPRGVYAALTGSSFETRAEYRMLRGLGADMVGMSSVPEVIIARHGGMEVLGFSLISDDCFPECLEPIDVELLLDYAGNGAEVIGKIIRGVLEDEEYCPVRHSDSE